MLFSCDWRETVPLDQQRTVSQFKTRPDAQRKRAGRKALALRSYCLLCRGARRPFTGLHDRAGAQLIESVGGRFMAECATICSFRYTACGYADPIGAATRLEPDLARPINPSYKQQAYKQQAYKHGSPYPPPQQCFPRTASIASSSVAAVTTVLTSSPLISTIQLTR